MAPYIDEKTLATKAVGVSSTQTVLLRIKQDPGSVQAFEVDHVGRIYVHFNDRTIHYAGRLQDKYWSKFGRFNVISSQITGGVPTEKGAREGIEGKIVYQPLTLLGLNLKLKEGDGSSG